LKLFYPKLGKHKLSCLLILFAGIIGNPETDLFAQSSGDSLTELPIVDIIASRLDEYTIGLNHEKIDSLSLTYYRTSSLASVLGDLTPIFIKSYGVGSLSTISFRGTAAHHSGVYWNGFNLNPANIGMSDLSLFPLAFFESVEILYGGASSLYGSGNIGGGLHLKNLPAFYKMKKIDVELAYGSFNEMEAIGTAVMANSKWYSKTVIMGKNMLNDFTYTNYNVPEPIEERQQNSELSQYGIMQDIHRKISSDQYVYLGLWYQKSSRNIPPTLTMSESKAWQIDRAFRSSLRYTKYFKRGTVNLKAAWFSEFLHYVDEISNIDSEILVNTIMSELEWKCEISGNLHMNTGLSYSSTTADIEAYNGDKNQNSLAFYLMLIHEMNFIPWKVNLNMRQELIEGYKVPFTPSLGFEGKIWNFIYGKMNFSQNFRIPSMNDRYWIPGGNENLEPEKSLNEEVSIIFKPMNMKKSLNADISLSIFNALIKNWIQWIPSSQGFWTPENIMEVRSRGVEFRTRLSLMTKHIITKINLGYTYTKSTNVHESHSLNGKQLIYVPLHKVSGQIIIETRFFTFLYSQSYNGIRYILRDNSESLPAYSVANVNISKGFKIKKQQLRLQFDVFNIWGREYQSIAYRPMPGRSYKLGLRFMIN